MALLNHGPIWTKGKRDEIQEILHRIRRALFSGCARSLVETCLWYVGTNRGLRCPDVCIVDRFHYSGVPGCLGVSDCARIAQYLVNFNQPIAWSLLVTDIIFSPYRNADHDACMSVFDANCPEFFAPNERQDYLAFLEGNPEGYEVCRVRGSVCGAFGLSDDGEDVKTLNWILIDPQTQGIGVGSRIMDRVIGLGRISQTRIVKIAASHKSAAFFARFGAIVISSTKDGWGTGMDRVDMELAL